MVFLMVASVCVDWMWRLAKKRWQNPGEEEGEKICKYPQKNNCFCFEEVMLANQRVAELTETLRVYEKAIVDISHLYLSAREENVVLTQIVDVLEQRAR
jgi:hypothetical protein